MKETEISFDSDKMEKACKLAVTHLMEVVSGKKKPNEKSEFAAKILRTFVTLRAVEIREVKLYLKNYNEAKKMKR